MGVPLLKGRLFNESDAADAKGRVVINETMARRHWPGEDPIGKRVRISWDDLEDEVIGVVGDVKHAGPRRRSRAMTYWPFARNPYGTMTVAVRTDRRCQHAIVTSIVGLVRGSSIPSSSSPTSRRWTRWSPTRSPSGGLTMLLLAIFAGAGAAAGGGRHLRRHRLQRHAADAGDRHPDGARRAARATCCAWSSGRRSSSPLAGIVVGGAGALLLTRLMEGLLFQVKPADPLTFAVVSGILAAVALLASYIPGRRATRVDPVIALRAE